MTGSSEGTRVVRKVRGHHLYNLTGTMTSFIMYIIIFNNVSGIYMRKMMVIQSAVYLLHWFYYRHYAMCGAGVRIIMTF